MLALQLGNKVQVKVSCPSSLRRRNEGRTVYRVGDTAYKYPLNYSRYLNLWVPGYTKVSRLPGGFFETLPFFQFPGSTFTGNIHTTGLRRTPAKDLSSWSWTVFFEWCIIIVHCGFKKVNFLMSPLVSHLGFTTQFTSASPDIMSQLPVRSSGSASSFEPQHR